jgi:hypothetical protein
MYEPSLLKRYENVYEAYKYVKGALATRPLNQPFNDFDIEFILRFHPRRTTRNLSFIRHLIIKMINKRRVLFANIFSEEEEIVSIVRCLYSMYTLSKHPKQQVGCINDAFRYIIMDSSSFLRRRRCDQCYFPSHTILYIKDTKFEDILRAFFFKHDVDLLTIKLYDVNNRIFISQAHIIEAWKEFYKAMVDEEQFICYDCYYTIHEAEASATTTEEE